MLIKKKLGQEQADVFKNFFKADDFEKEFQNQLGPEHKKQFYFINMVRDYCKAMGLESSVDFKVDNVTVDLILPESKQIIYVYRNQEQNYDEKSFKG